MVLSCMPLVNLFSQSLPEQLESLAIFTACEHFYFDSQRPFPPSVFQSPSLILTGMFLSWVDFQGKQKNKTINGTAAGKYRYSQSIIKSYLKIRGPYQLSYRVFLCDIYHHLSYHLSFSCLFMVYEIQLERKTHETRSFICFLLLLEYLCQYPSPSQGRCSEIFVE